MKYFGIDWLAMMLTFLAIWQMGNKNRIGFILMMSGNLAWASIGFLMGSYAMIIANVIFCSMNIWAFIKWSTPVKSSSEQSI